MPANKELNKLASQFSQLAKFYLANLSGTPAEVAKREKALLNHVRKSHQQLRIKGTALMRENSSTRGMEESDCSGNGYKCPDGTCVVDSTQCS